MDCSLVWIGRVEMSISHLQTKGHQSSHFSSASVEQQSVGQFICSVLTHILFSLIQNERLTLKQRRQRREDKRLREKENQRNEINS